MDPVTAALNVANALIALEGKIFDAMPADQKAIIATDAAKFTHNIGTFVTSLQEKLNKLVA